MQLPVNSEDLADIFAMVNSAQTSGNRRTKNGIASRVATKL
jgi:hypothetical protein